MTEPVLGKLIDGIAERDAVHIAIIPLIAGERLYSGHGFRLKRGTNDIALAGHGNPLSHESPEIGVVDPFLLKYGNYCVNEGDRFWGFLYPGTVTGIRHHWEHPQVEDQAGFDDSHEEWLMNFCDKWNFSFQELIAAAVDTGNEFRCVVAGGIDLHDASELGEDYELFWSHLEAYTGKKFDAEHRNDMNWSCSC